MLGKLGDVQTRDLELDALTAELDQTPEALIAARAQMVSLQARLEEREQVAGQLRKEVRGNELELESLQARKRSASASALSAGSAKEASQYQNQELMISTRLEELEADTLPLMERLEAVQGEVAQLEGEIAELQPSLDELTLQEEVRRAEVVARMESVKRERDALAATLDGSLLKQYEQVRRARRGVGLAQVVGGERCGGCNVRLPIHVLQKVKRGAGVTRCPSCGRILWTPDE